MIWFIASIPREEEYRLGINTMLMTEMKPEAKRLLGNEPEAGCDEILSPQSMFRSISASRHLRVFCNSAAYEDNVLNEIGAPSLPFP
jgi:hypothetical protein